MYEYITDASCDRTKQGLIYFDRTIKYAEFIGEIDGLSEWLTSVFGIKKGENAAICLPNIPQAVFAFYACNRLGAVCNMVHPLLSSNGILEIIEKTKPKILFIADIFYSKHEKMIKECKIPTVVCEMSTFAPIYMRPLMNFKFRKERAGIEYSEKIFKYTDIANFGKGIEKDGREEKISFPKGNDVAVYLHSGGTSGAPKTIVHTNRAMNCHTKSCLAACGEIKDGVMLMAMPLFHGFGLGVCMHTTLSDGQRAALFPKFDANSVAKAIKKYKIGYLVGVPLMYEKLLKDEFFQKIDKSHFKKLLVGGDTLSPDIKKRFDELLRAGGSPVGLLEGYGLTETVSIVSGDWRMGSKLSAVGQPFPGVKIIIVDENLRELENGQIGEILVHSEYIMEGYYNDPNATAKTVITGDKITFLKDSGDNEADKNSDADLRNGITGTAVLNRENLEIPLQNAGNEIPLRGRGVGVGRPCKDEKWVRTDDVGYFDGDGDLHFVNRKKRIVKIAGINVYPSEIERIASDFPEVGVCCAVEGKNDGGKTCIKLYVVPSDGSSVDEAVKEKIKKACADNLIVYSVPSEIIVKRELPVTPMFKVDYSKL
jgi:long-chain acyl-CoA synthetase